MFCGGKKGSGSASNFKNRVFQIYCFIYCRKFKLVINDLNPVAAIRNSVVDDMKNVSENYIEPNNLSLRINETSYTS